MTTKFTVFGSCACRDIFFSGANKDYKKYFEIDNDGIRLSFISIMQPPVKYNEDSLKILPETEENINFSQWIKNDLDKIFLRYLIENNIEYLMIDTYYDTAFGIIDIGNGQFITKNKNIEKTDFYKNLEKTRTLTIQDNTKEYLELWKNSCNLFFKYLNDNCSNIKIILNPNRHVHNYIKNNSILKSEDFQKDCDFYNYYRDLLDEYIIKNFDVEVLDFDENTLADENHIWGPYSLHYSKEYFNNMNIQLNEIIKRNNLLKSKEYLEINKKIREIKRENLLLKIKKRYSEKLNSKYFTARIDLKNTGNINNNINILKNSDLQSKQYIPTWFKDNNGQGTIIESKNSSLDLEIEMIGDGFFEIAIKGLDIRDKNNNRFPVFIDYTKLILNDEILLNENTLTTHDQPKIFSINVKDKEKIKLHIEWKGFSKYSDYNNDIFKPELKELKKKQKECEKNRILRNYGKKNLKYHLKKIFK